MTDVDPVELLETLLSRRELLDRLEHGPRSKPELVRACGVSRSTVDRGIGTLLDAGIVARGSKSRYELTLFGGVVVREFRRMFGRIETLAAAGDLLADLDAGTGLTAELFDDATISHTGGMGVAVAFEAFAGATTLRIVDPPLPLVLLGLLTDPGRLCAGEVTALVRSDILAELLEVSPWEAGDDLVRGVDLHEMDERLPFSFALVDRPTGRRLCLLLGNGQDGLVVVETDRTAAVEWGEALYDRVLADARLVPVRTRS